MRQRFKIRSLSSPYNSLVEVGQLLDEAGNSVALLWNLESGILWVMTNRHHKAKKHQVGEALSLKQLAMELKRLAFNISEGMYYNYVQGKAGRIGSPGG